MFGQKEPAGQGVQVYKKKGHLLQRNRTPFTATSLIIASKFARSLVDSPDVRMK